MSEMTPMMSQYLQIKKEYSDAILFFRLGDFYEMFFDDAITASKVLELTLTARSYSKGEKAPMCGVPFHSAEGYIAKLVSAGFKVAICEQTEDPATAKGIVKRDVIRVITKGSIIENNMLDDSKNNYLACVYFDGTNGGVCFCDVSTGILNLTNFTNEHTTENNIINEIGTFAPSEILLNKGAAHSRIISNFISKRTEAACEILDDYDFEAEDCRKVCLDHFGEEKFRAFDFSSDATAVSVTGALLRYLKNVQKNNLDNIREVNYYSDSQFMKLDYNTLRNLEILETMRDREKKGSLLWVLDKTHTSMVKRLLRNWLEKPLVSLAQITRRHNAVSELYDKNIMLIDISSSLSKVYDIERLITRVMFESANAKDLNSLKQTIECIPVIKVLLQSSESAYLRQQYQNLDLLEDVGGLIDMAIKEDAPFSVREGDMIKDGFNAELDELRNIQGNGKQFILDIEQREREATGIPKLKIGYNRVFGYYIEVTNSYKDMVPDTYFRKQTLANCERYITQELKELESK
ncbi:MAG: DNA mismatch repair protein MutS, partial [Clostridia bacterium]|nr:DNA mismatch repair protein MutS [Clostridia bacterium]